MLLVLSTLLTACGRATSTPGVPATPAAVATSTHATAVAKVAPTSIPPHAPTLTSTSKDGPLPFVVAAITLGEESRACAVSALAIDQATGYLYAAGVRYEPPPSDTPYTPCLSVIDPATSQVLDTHGLPCEPESLLWDSGTLYVIGQDEDNLVIADANTGQIVAYETITGYLSNGRAVVRDGWAYVGLPGDTTLGSSGTLYLIPLRGGATLTIPDAQFFDLADDGRIAVAGGQGTTIVRIYAGTGGTLLAEREIGPGQPEESLAFDGQTNRIYVAREQPTGDTTPPRYFVDVLDATSLGLINSTEVLVWMLTADPSRGRIYGYAPGGQIAGFDAASSQFLGTLFSIPQGEPEGFTAISRWEKLHIDPATGRVYVVYEDFDSSAWAAGFDPATGKGRADVQVPSSTAWAEDSARGRLYFANGNLVLALHADTLQPVYRMALSRQPVSVAIAPDSGYLFAGDAGGDVHVLDLQTHAEVQVLPGVGGYVDVDPAHGWLYAGDEFAAGISVYDLAPLERRGLVPQPGRPTASPADGQVYILEEDVYSGDGATLAVIKGRTVRNTGCNGCSAPTSVIVDPRTGRTHVTTYSTWVGKPGPTSHATIDPLTGRTFVARTTGGYQVRYTLAAYADLTLEQPLAWRDGLYGQPLYNPATGHLYLTDSVSRLLVLEGETLDLLGWLYPGAETLTPAAVDVHSGRAYLLADSQVLVLEGTGGRFETPPPRPATHLSGPPEGIVPLPNGTLFVRAYDHENYIYHFYRSTDGGQTWEELYGGLPGIPNDLAAAPDSTLYAAAVPTGWRAEMADASWGEGVYRSDDGGDTWAPFSRGLVHLRVGRIHVSADGNVNLLAVGAWPEQPDSPAPTIWQLSKEERWNQVQVAEAGPSIGPDGAVPYTYTQAIGVAWHALAGEHVLYRSWGNELQRSADASLTWETIGTGPADYGVAVLTGLGKPPALYWLTWDAVYRSTDEGASWARLWYLALADSAPSALAVGEWNGEETLFVGTEAGELLILPAVEAAWRTEGTPGP